MYGSVRQSGDGACQAIERSDTLRKTKNGEKEHGCSGTKTANFQHGKQACSPLSYDGCCWVHALYEGYKSLCFHHVYIATADNLDGRTTFRAIDILARNIIIISTAIIWQPGEYHLVNQCTQSEVHKMNKCTVVGYPNSEHRM